MRGVLIATLGLLYLCLALMVGVDLARLDGRSPVGSMSNGVVARDILVRSQSELQPYDHIRKIRNKDGTSWANFVARDSLAPRSTLDVQVARGGRNLELQISPQVWNLSLLSLTFAAPIGVSALLIVSALTLAWRPRQDPAAMAVVAVVSCLSLQIILALDANWGHRLDPLYVATTALFPFTLIHLALTFPRPAALIRETSAVIRSLYLIAVSVVCASLVMASNWEGRWTLMMRILELATLIAGLVLAIRIGAALVGSSAPAERYRARILAYGAGLAFGVPALCFLIDLVAPSNLSGAVLPISAAAIPMSIGIAVGRSDLLGVDGLYRRLVIPSAVTACSVVALLLILASIFRVAGTQDAFSSPAFSTTLVLVLTLLLEGARRLLFAGVERFHPSAETRIRRFLEQAEHSLTRDSAAHALEFACRFLRDEFRPSFVAIFWTDPASGRLRTIHSAGEIPPEVAEIDLAPESESVRRLLEAPYYASNPALRAPELEGWVEAGLGKIEVAVPMRTQDRAVGALAIGLRRRGYGLEDLELLNLLAKAIALIWDHEEHLRRLQAQLRERSATLARALEQVVESPRQTPLCPDNDDRFAWVGKLAAGISHEANKPLYVIEHHLRRLRNAHGADIVRLRAIEIEFAQVRRLMQDLQAYAGSHNGTRERVLIADLVDRAADHLSASGTKLRIDCSGALDLEAELDAELTLRLLAILLENASEAGAEKANVRLAREGHGAVIEVEDNGPGIPEGLEQHIFEPFFTTGHIGSASGLGLAIALEIARAHGGTLRLERGPAGARFVVELPLYAQGTPSG